MSLISRKMLFEDQSYLFEKIDDTQESYWKHTGLDYRVEEYEFLTVMQLKRKIEESTGVSPEVAEHIAMESFKRHFGKCDMAGESEIRTEKLPEFVYRL